MITYMIHWYLKYAKGKKHALACTRERKKNLQCNRLNFNWFRNNVDILKATIVWWLACEKYSTSCRHKNALTKKNVQKHCRSSACISEKKNMFMFIFNFSVNFNGIKSIIKLTMEKSDLDFRDSNHTFSSHVNK